MMLRAAVYWVLGHLPRVPWRRRCRRPTRRPSARARAALPAHGKRHLWDGQGYPQMCMHCQTVRTLESEDTECTRTLVKVPREAAGWWN